MSAYRAEVMVCGGAGCISSGCKEVRAALGEELSSFYLTDQIRLVLTGCIGSCALGPVVVVYPEGVFYQRVKADDVRDIVEQHLVGGRPVERLMYCDPQTNERVCHIGEIGFFRGQRKLVLRNCGIIDPEDIRDYIARGGYAALRQALTAMTPAQIIEEVTRSGLRGRGGAGFPTGLKWKFCAEAAETPKYVVCNADEGDPGAFMDRSVLEGDPHSVLEAMAIAGYTIGSSQGYLYVRAEYPLALERLEIAVREARNGGHLGRDIMGTGFAFDVEIRVGAGAFVCGEETALLQSIEGKRGMPRPRPPFPALQGLWGKPTLINNVETYANIPLIILQGGEWFARTGTEKSRGTKVFALAGDINLTGLVEVPMGITLREIVYDIGGGMPGGRGFKAAQTGGPSGGCISAKYLDTPIDYDSLVRLGAIMGSGGLIIMDEDTCMVDIAKFFLSFTHDESCGKCTPCREGISQMLEILERISQGRGVPEDMDMLENLASMVKATALCGLGQTAPNPVLSTMQHFREEYEAHIIEKRCPARACRALVQFAINADTCRGCGLCQKACPSGAISGTVKKPHVISQLLCLKCGLCEQACKFGAVEKS